MKWEQIKVVYHKHLLLVPITPDIQLPFSGLRKLAPIAPSGVWQVRRSPQVPVEGCSELLSRASAPQVVVKQ